MAMTALDSLVHLASLNDWRLNHGLGRKGGQSWEGIGWRDFYIFSQPHFSWNVLLQLLSRGSYVRFLHVPLFFNDLNLRLDSKILNF